MNTETDTLSASAHSAAHQFPVFTSEAFLAAADAIDWWVGTLTSDRAEEDAAHTALLSASHMVTGAYWFRHSMGLTRTDCDILENLSATSTVREVLEHAVVEVHGLAPAQRGLYLAQLMTRACSDGTFDLIRFRVANALAAYVAAMPSIGSCTGLLEHDDSDLNLVGWSNAYGDFVDVVSVGRQADAYVDADTAEALAFGASAYPSRFAGVRYLPLESMTGARFYRPDGTWEPVVERFIPPVP